LIQKFIQSHIRSGARRTLDFCEKTKLHLTGLGLNLHDF
jgi:hypothetical protein